MGKVNYSTTTVNKEGTFVEGDLTYNVNITIVNNELQRLACSIAKIQDTQATHIGTITMEYGRQITEIVQGENLIPHLTKFQAILDEVLGKTPETTDAKTTTKN